MRDRAIRHVPGPAILPCESSRADLPWRPPRTTSISPWPASATTCTRPIAELKETPAETGVMVDGGEGQPVANGVLAALVAHRTLADQLGGGARTADRGRGCGASVFNSG